MSVSGLEVARKEVSVKVFYLLPVVALLGAALWLHGSDRASAGGSLSNSASAPVLVELFTSEGCSSCPPADAYLQKLDAQPTPGTQFIVLSEHVDYWNHIGWEDPYSSAAFSQRQDRYGTKLGLESVYTPQMVVDGVSEFVGSNHHEAEQAFAKAHTAPKVEVRISNVTLKDGVVRAHVDSAQLPQNKKADVVFVVALNHADSQVAHGENAGRHLTHVAVVKSLSRVGTADAGKAFSSDVSVKVDGALQANNLRVVAFLQEPGQGRVLGVASESSVQ
jgi:hypothetical protein